MAPCLPWPASRFYQITILNLSFHIAFRHVHRLCFPWGSAASTRITNWGGSIPFHKPEHKTIAAATADTRILIPQPCPAPIPFAVVCNLAGDMYAPSVAASRKPRLQPPTLSVWLAYCSLPSHRLPGCGLVLHLITDGNNPFRAPRSPQPRIKNLVGYHIVLLTKRYSVAETYFPPR